MKKYNIYNKKIMSKQNTNTNQSNSIGKIITFGSLNLFLTLRLEREDLTTNFNYLQSLEDLTFLTENEKLWERIELTSKNELFNTLLRMNRIKQNKNIISYLVLDKLNYKEEQSKFQKLLDYVLFENGFVVHSYEVCSCQISINLKLLYKKRMKKFVICGEEDYDQDEMAYNVEEEEEKKNEKENQNQSQEEGVMEPQPQEEGKKENEEEKKDDKTDKNEKKEEKNSKKGENNDNTKEEEEEEESENENVDPNDIGYFEKIPDEEVKFGDFKYIYINYKDFQQGGELSNQININQLYNYLGKLKKNGKIKIIMNFGENFRKKNIYKFLKISDIHIFRDRNELLGILKKRMTKEESKKEKESQQLLKLLKTQKIPKITKKLESKNTSMINMKDDNKTSRKGFNSSLNNDSFIKMGQTLNKSQSMKSIYAPKSLNGTFEKYKYKKGSLDKNNMHIYLREIIFMSKIKEKHPNYNDKLGIYLDQYKRIYIVQYKKSLFVPNVSEYNLNIYPKPNVHNKAETDKIDKILCNDKTKYNNILYSCIISCIIDDIDNYFMYYYYSHISILKVLALEKNKLPIPKDKKFYIVQIDKKELNKMEKEENTKQKENGFNNNHFQVKYKGNDSKYYPLMDKFLTSYMQSMVNIDILKNKNLINEKKKILYDPEYKDIYKLGNYNEDINDVKFAKFIMKETKNIKTKEKDYKKEFMSKKPEMKYHLPGINGIPEYAVYLSKNERKKLIMNKLPPIKQSKKPKRNIKNQKNKNEKKEENEKEEVIKLKNNNLEKVEKKEEKLNEAGNKFMVEQLDEEKEKEKEKEKKKKINTDKYKEIKFEKTQLESNNN